MTEEVTRAWTCGTCSRRVPARVDRCRCDAERPFPEEPDVEVHYAPAAGEGREPEASPDRAEDAARYRRIALTFVALALVVAALAWRPWSSAGPSKPAAIPPGSAGAPSAPQPEDSATSAAPFKVELPPDLQAQLAPAPPPAAAPAVSPSATAEAGGIEEAVQRVIAAVVQIQSDAGRGTGFFTAGGLLVTNAHVVGTQSYVSLKLSDGQSCTGQVLRTAPAMDLAIVRPDRAGGLPAALPMRPLAEVRVGQEVLAVGSALGVLQNTVTRGIVSAIRAAGGVTLVQTDAAVNPGNSGGPLVDRQGWVVGVTTLKVGGQAESLSFAVASDHARSLLEGRADALAQAGGTLQDRLNTTMAADGASGGERTREDATVELERRVKALAQAADRIDASWRDYRANCLQTATIPRGYDREWFILVDRVPQRSPSPSCAPWTDELVRAALEVREALDAALATGRTAGVFPGDQREICRRYRLEWRR